MEANDLREGGKGGKEKIGRSQRSEQILDEATVDRQGIETRWGGGARTRRKKGRGWIREENKMSWSLPISARSHWRLFLAAMGMIDHPDPGTIIIIVVSIPIFL